VDIEIGATVLVTILLVSVRLSGLFLFSPLFSLTRLPVRLRVLFLLSFSAVVTMGTMESVVVKDLTLGRLTNMVVNELLVGGIMAFGVYAAFAAFMFGGRILDFQMGMGVANLIDPSTNTQSPLIGTFLNLTGVMVFFLVDGHHMILQGVHYSLEMIPPGAGLNQFNLAAISSQFGVLFIFGFALVAPAVMILLLLDVGMAFAARTMPQVNMFIVGIPLKIFLGLLTLAFSLNYITPLLGKLYKSIFLYWEAML